MTQVLVTGGAGFIGSHLVDELVGADCEVHVVDNFMNGRREHIAALADDQVHSGDLRDAEWLAALVARLAPRHVYHLAAIHFIPYCNDHPSDAVLINILGTRNLLSALAGSLPASLFFASTAAVYPPKSGAHLESDAAAPTDIYGATKLAGEALIESFAAATGMPCVVGRLFNAVGHRETNPHLVPEIVRQLAGGARSIRLGNLDPTRDFIDARDMARGIAAASSHVRSGTDTFNIGASRQYSVVDVVRICERILGEPIQIGQDPARIRKVERPSLLAGIEKLTRATGWQPRIGLEQTLTELLEAR